MSRINLKRPQCAELPLPPSPKRLKSTTSLTGFQSKGSGCHLATHLTLDKGETPRIRRHCFLEVDGAPDPVCISSEDAVKALVQTYCSYFINPLDESDDSFMPHRTDYPVVELEYPNTNSSERFILLCPKDRDHYNPIQDLQATFFLTVIVRVSVYLTPAQRALFGPLPNDRGTSFTTSGYGILTERCSFVSDNPDNLSTVSNDPNHLCSLQDSIDRQDGPSFFKTVTAINIILRGLKYPPVLDACENLQQNQLKDMVHSWSATGVPPKVVCRIYEEAYQRSVGPNVQLLKNHSGSLVYGEVLPRLVQEFITRTQLREDSLFLDLGSGVGNVLCQVSLQTGCRSHGIELNRPVAKIARSFVANFKARCRMWGISPGKIELEEGDMVVSGRVESLIREADVVLVNNRKFEPALNYQLLSKRFGNLKEGAYILSLEPFANDRVPSRNVGNDVSGILAMKTLTYHPDDASWGPGGGTYYLHCVVRNR
ncbi:histone methylation protein DOT1-domain-containing protein [Mycena polygramma]|nr:histone methylation protein DOT1-domain-containing protein [Mycena polygramma]